MKYQQYKMKFYLNCRHAIYIDGKIGDIHPHTWEFVVHIAKVRDKFVPFSDTEQNIEEILDPYQEQTLNTVKPFDMINPTLENCANYFRERFTSRLNSDGWILLLMEVSETPSRSYVMSMIDEQEIGQAQTINALTDSIIDSIRNAKI